MYFPPTDDLRARFGPGAAAIARAPAPVDSVQAYPNTHAPPADDAVRGQPIPNYRGRDRRRAQRRQRELPVILDTRGKQERRRTVAVGAQPHVGFDAYV